MACSQVASFDANKSAVEAGSEVNLTWAVSDPAGATIQLFGYGPFGGPGAYRQTQEFIAPSGSKNVRLPATGEYTFSLVVYPATAGCPESRREVKVTANEPVAVPIVPSPAPTPPPPPPVAVPIVTTPTNPTASDAAIRLAGGQPLPTSPTSPTSPPAPASSTGQHNLLVIGGATLLLLALLLRGGK